MRYKLVAPALFALLAGCSGAPENAAPPATFRELSVAEKSALAKSLSANLPAPSATQFRWRPVVNAASRGVHTGYCGELNGRNPDGGFSGYRRFFALLVPAANNEFLTGSIQSIAGPAVSGTTNSETRRVSDACRNWGYSG